MIWMFSFFFYALGLKIELFFSEQSFLGAVLQYVLEYKTSDISAGINLIIVAINKVAYVLNIQHTRKFNFNNLKQIQKNIIQIFIHACTDVFL